MRPADFHRLVQPSPGALRQLWQRLRSPRPSASPVSANLASSSSSSSSAASWAASKASVGSGFRMPDDDGSDRLRLPNRSRPPSAAKSRRFVAGDDHSQSPGNRGGLGREDSDAGEADWRVLAARFEQSGHQVQLPRLMGLDVGRSYVGVAVSDPGGLTVRPHSVINRRQLLDGRRLPVDKFGTRKGFLEQQQLRHSGGPGAGAGRARPAPTQDIPNAQVAAQLRELTERLNVCALVVGLPLPALEARNSDQGYERCHMVWDWIEAMRTEAALKLPVFWVSEAYTTQFAKYDLRDSGFNALEVDRRVDQEAAAIILRRFMDDLCEAEREL